MALLPSLTLPPSQIRTQLVRCLLAGLVADVRSSPGIGKSDIARSIAEEYHLELIDLRLGQMDITDLNGLPRFTADGRAEYAPFTNFPLEGDDLPEGKDGWLLFFDEMSSAGKQMQAAAYKVILDRMVGQRKLHPQVLMCCAGNLDTDRAVVHSMSTAMQSRLIHLQMRVDHREWMAWAVDHKIDSRIIGFLEFKPEYLHKFDPDHQDKTFACPRTWAFASRLVKGQSITNSDTPILAGTVSAGVAHEFVLFAQIFADLPKMAEVMSDPAQAPIPLEPSTRYAMATCVAEWLNEKTADKLMVYVKRYAVEFQVIILRMAHQRIPDLVRHPEVMSLFQTLVRQM